MPEVPTLERQIQGSFKAHGPASLVCQRDPVSNKGDEKVDSACRKIPRVFSGLHMHVCIHLQKCVHANTQTHI